MASSPPSHLFFLIHGLHGHPADLEYLGQQIETASLGTCMAHCAGSNNYFLATHDGVDAGAYRLSVELLGVLQKHPSIKELSIVGHSLGGVYARFMVGVLQVEGVLDRLKLHTFTTFASPHLGSRQHARLYGAAVTDVVCSFMGGTHKQLMLNDTYTGLQRLRDVKTLSPAVEALQLPPHPVAAAADADVGEAKDQMEVKGQAVPLLAAMTRADGPFMKGIARFGQLRLFANACGDLSVHYCTAAIALTNPYRKLPAGLSLDECPRVENCPILLDRERVRELIQAKRRKQAGEHAEEAALVPATFQSHPHLLNMQKSLSSLPWEKHDLAGRTFLAHTDLVVKVKLVNGSAGIPVIDFFVNKCLFKK